MEVEKLLYKEIKSEFECLEEMEAGTETYKTTVDGLTKLMDRAIEIDKINMEHEEKERNSQFEIQRQINDQKDRLVKNCISVAGIVIPVCVTIWGTLKSFKFEQDGTITTIMGRGFINKLLPKK